MGRRFMLYMIASILVHVFLLVPRTAVPKAQNTENQSPIQMVLLPKSEQTPKYEGEGDGVGLSRALKKDKCTKSSKKFMGIGVMWIERTGFIVDAPEGYPAHRAGVRPGDVVAGSKFTERGEYLIFEIERYNERLQFKLKMEKICYEERQNELIPISLKS